MLTTLSASLGLAVSFTGSQTAPDPYQLNLGPTGKVVLQPKTLTDLATGAPASLTDVAVRARQDAVIFVGESHDQLAHHEFQAAVIEALVADGRDVVIGFEMFSRFNDGLNGWTLGWWDEPEFILKSDWKTQWGFDFALYRPIFNAAKRHRLPMVGLNVPRDWVRRVGRQGTAGLTAEEKAQVPAIETTYEPHRQVFTALMGGHPMTGAQGENIYSAQVLWDVAMADSAAKTLKSMPPNRRTILVVIAGVGHVMYGAGINYRLKQQTGWTGLTLIPVSASEPVTVSRGLGDYAISYPATKP